MAGMALISVGLLLVGGEREPGEGGRLGRAEHENLTGVVDPLDRAGGLGGARDPPRVVGDRLNPALSTRLHFSF